MPSMTISASFSRFGAFKDVSPLDRNPARRGSTRRLRGRCVQAPGARARVAGTPVRLWSQRAGSPAVIGH